MWSVTCKPILVTAVVNVLNKYLSLAVVFASRFQKYCDSWLTDSCRSISHWKISLTAFRINVIVMNCFFFRYCSFFKYNVLLVPDDKPVIHHLKERLRNITHTNILLDKLCRQRAKTFGGGYIHVMRKFYPSDFDITKEDFDIFGPKGNLLVWLFLNRPHK